MPSRAAAEIAGVIERQHRRFLERRREKRRRRVRQVMLHHDDFGVRELVAQREVKIDSGPRANGRTTATQSTWSRVAPARRRHSSIAACGNRRRARTPRVSFASSTAARSSPSFRTAHAASAEQSAESENDHGLFRFLLDLGPGVAQRHGAVEHQLLRRRVGIDAEVAQPLELIAAARRGVARGSAPACSRSATSSEFGFRLSVNSWPSVDLVRIFLA